jgi:peptidoglycan hydrolase CwlO-like protein
MPSVSDQWSAVFAAPVPFFLAVVAVATVIWAAILWRYKGVNEKRAELYDLLNRKAELDTQVAAKAQNELKETVASLEAQKASLTTEIEDLQAKAQIDQAQKDQLSEKLGRLEQTISTAGRQLGTLSEANNAVSRTLSDSRRLISTTLPSY